MEDRSELAPSHRRADIQGLRAVAILLVVACHAEVALPGGFIGVDVFFVISGFVIGGLLRRQLATGGSVSFAAFYSARARRLLPLLATVLLVGLVLGVGLLGMWSRETAFGTAATASVFVSNLYLYRHTGYFDEVSDATNPFLHLWSLSVEEQFYVVLPLLLVVLWRVTRRRRRPHRSVAAVLALLAVASFALSWFLSQGGGTSVLEAPGRFAFFSAATRFWELALGVVLALLPGVARRIGPQVATVVGVGAAVALLAGARWIEPLAPYPGTAALVPVIATAALLVAGERSRWVSGALSVRPLTWIGDRSYGWYLWHWPLIVYARIVWPEPGWIPTAAAVAALALAAATYAAFEDRLRRNRAIVGRRAAVLAAGCIAVPGLLAFGLHRQGEHGWTVAEPLAWYDTSPAHLARCTIPNRDLPDDWPAERCTFGPDASEATGTVLVLGDGHAEAVSGAVGEVAAERGWRTAVWSRAGCPFVAAAPTHYSRCAEWQEAAWGLIDQLQPDVVVVANRSSWYTTEPPSSFGAVDPLERDGTVAGSQEQATQLWGDAVADTVHGIEQRGSAAVVVGPVPDHADGFRVPSPWRPDIVEPARPRPEVDRVLGPVIDVERSAVASGERSVYLDPVPLVCGDQVCEAAPDGRWIYADAHHLNNAGARLLAPELAAAFDQLATPPG